MPGLRAGHGDAGGRRSARPEVLRLGQGSAERGQSGLLEMATAALPYAAFVSYAPLDWAKANDICAILEDHGQRCLLAPRGLRGGRGSSGQVLKAMEQSRAFVLVVSKATEGSHPVQEEMRTAVQRRMPMFAIFVEPPDPSSDLDLPVSQQARIGAWSGRLADHVAKLAGYLPGAKTGPASIVREREPAAWVRKATGTPGILAALMASALLLWGFLRLLEHGLRSLLG